MTIDEAIKLQRELTGLLPEVGFDKYIASTYLGIEALKRIKAQYDPDHQIMREPLPGETKEKGRR